MSETSPKPDELGETVNPRPDQADQSVEHESPLEQFRRAFGENLGATVEGLVMGEDYNDTQMSVDPLSLFLDMSDERTFAELPPDEQAVIIQAISEQFGIPLADLERAKSVDERQASVPLADPEPTDSDMFWHTTRHQRVYVQEWERPEATKEWSFIKLREDRIKSDEGTE